MGWHGPCNQAYARARMAWSLQSSLFLPVAGMVLAIIQSRNARVFFCPDVFGWLQQFVTLSDTSVERLGSTETARRVERER